jgi:hypothetical protein
VPEASCRACRSRDGQLVLDLGEQPASDYFPLQDTPGPDPVYPLQMWLCLSCGLAQLLADSTVPEEPRGVEPAALVEQATDAIARVHAAGWLRPGMRVMEYGSPHGGSWMSQLEQYGLSTTSEGDRADIVLDCFGLMHAADQAEALAIRAALVAPRGVLLLQYHSLATILRLRQWNSLRHGHYAYYSTTTLVAMLAEVGLTPRSAWEFDLYGGTVLLAASRTAGPGTVDDESIRALLDEEAELGVRDPASFRHLQESVTLSAEALHDWLTDQKAAGASVMGYGAASRAVALLCRAGIDQGLLMAVADASPAKHGRRMPGTNIPVVSPQNMLKVQADAVLLFLPDLLNELRDALPEIEAMGRRWVSVEDLV